MSSDKTVIGTSAIILKALGYAECAHRTQVRKYTGKPYITHPRAVAALLNYHGMPDFVCAAALLHDVIEDCGVLYTQVEAAFGANVATLVWECTDVYTREAFPSLNRETRKGLECVRVSSISAYAQSIKVADLIDNTSDITMHDRKFARTYLKEKQAMLDVLTKASPTLLFEAADQVLYCERILRDH